MAVVISLLATALPWGPIMAFLVSSPLMSPDAFVLYAGILGVNFAVALTVASVGIGLAGGYIAYALEKTTRFLDGQIRFAAAGSVPAAVTGSYAEAASPATKQSSCGCAAKVITAAPAACCNSTPAGMVAIEDLDDAASQAPEPACCGGMTPISETAGCGCDATPVPASCCSSAATPHTATIAPSCGCAVPAPASACGCGASAAPVANARNAKLNELLHEIYDIGVKKILVYFSLFAAIGFFVNKLVPAELVVALFNGSHWYAVPLAALIGLPLYVTGASALPLLQVLLHAGASSGAVLAFLITGPATSVGVIAGIATIMKQKAIALYVAIILAGGIIAGYGYDLILQMLQG